MSLFWIFVASFCYVALRSFQQINVVTGAYTLVFITSHLMAVGDTFLVAKYAVAGGPSLPLVLVVGTSAGLGSCFSMWIRKYISLWIHKYIVRERSAT